MFALPPLVALVVFILARPLDFVEELRDIPFLYIFSALSVFGLVLDARLGYARLRATPQLKWALAVVLLALLSDVVMAPDVLVEKVVSLIVVLTVFLLVSQSVQRFKALEVVAGAVVFSTLWIALVCVHQGLQPLTCVAVDQKDDQSAMGRPDGRPCETVEACFEDPPEPQAIYRCEHAGLLGTTSIGDGRVRYLGVLHDPNEVALTVSLAMPLSLAIYQRRRKKRHLALAFATFSLASLTVVMSQSRGGILVFLTVFAVYFLKRFGWRGVFAGIALALPVLLLGGRSGGTAASSTTERLEVWIEGLEMVRAFPTLGVGYAQFTEHHPLTAHNSVLLAAAEGGLIAAMLWTAVIYVSLKIPLQVLRDVDQPGGAVARTWALALLASTAAATVGCMFLSFNYHFVLWIYVGMTASLATCVARHQPSFRVRFGVRDLVVVAGGTVSVLVAIFVATRAAWA